jgi:hypothetical protein
LRWLLVLSLLYPLTHISFFTLIVFAIVCEVLRYLYDKELFLKNIYAVAIGTAAGCVVHPNFPNNLFSTYLNGIVAPLSAMAGIDLGFAGEFRAYDTKLALIGNFAVFFTLFIIAWISFSARRRISLASAVWFAFTSIYLFLAFFSVRYWYQVNTLFFIFFASYVHDAVENEDWTKMLKGINISITLYLIITLVFLVPNVRRTAGFMEYFIGKNAHCERVGRWMARHIPPNQTIYHSYWDDSPYFICLNPKDNYLNVLDPIYMYYRYPREFAIMEDLSMGRIYSPHEVFEKVFKVRYGYLRKQEPLCRQISDDPRHFSVLYEDNDGIVFELLK